MTGLRFRIGGIPVQVDPTFLLIILLLGWGARSGGLLVAWVVVATGAVLLHELGHAVAFRLCGQQPRILLQGLGGLTFAPARGMSRVQHIAVSLAGPGVGLVLVGLPALAVVRADLVASSFWEVVVGDVVWVSIGWSVLNLVPVLPLDGGNVAKSVFDVVTDGRGEVPARVLSVVVGGTLALAALAWGYLFGALFAGFFAVINLRGLSDARRQPQREELVAGFEALMRGDHRAAAAAAGQVLGARPPAELRAPAAELMAWAQLDQGDVAGAEAALRSLPEGATPDPFLWGALALAAGRREEGLETLVRAATEHPDRMPTSLMARVARRAGALDDLARLLGDVLGGAGRPELGQLARTERASEGESS